MKLVDHIEILTVYHQDGKFNDFLWLYLNSVQAGRLKVQNQKMFEILLPAVLEIRRRRPSLVTANLMVPFGWAMILKNKEEDKAQLDLIKGVLKNIMPSMELWGKSYISIN